MALGPNGRLAVDHPFDIAQWSQICGEGLCLAQQSMVAEELQLSANSRRNRRVGPPVKRLANGAGRAHDLRAGAAVERRSLVVS
jgi:hypothetical protein